MGKFSIRDVHGMQNFNESDNIHSFNQSTRG